MTIAAKDVISGKRSPQLESFSNFFKELSGLGDDEHALTLLEAFFQYARTRDDSVLRRLPLEERQLLEALKERLQAQHDAGP